MCDFSLQAVASRPAVVGEKLVTKNFGSGTRGFAPEDNSDVAVCLLPGTELAFAEEIKTGTLYNMVDDPVPHGTRVARFTQVNKDTLTAHHDALQLPDKGDQIIMLTNLAIGQIATVLQLPAAPRNEAEAQEQKRLEIVG